VACWCWLDKIVWRMKENWSLCGEVGLSCAILKAISLRSVLGKQNKLYYHLPLTPRITLLLPTMHVVGEASAAGTNQESIFEGKSIVQWKVQIQKWEKTLWEDLRENWIKTRQIRKGQRSMHSRQQSSEGLYWGCHSLFPPTITAPCDTIQSKELFIQSQTPSPTAHGIYITWTSTNVHHSFPWI
jgi:hypothetical protein